MTVQNLQQKLIERFSAPLEEFHYRRIIFWQDPVGEFSTLVDELELPGVKVLKLSGVNNFAAKMLLTETDLDSHFLVYNPLSYAEIGDNWLLDIECYSEEFRADLISIQMAELGMPSTIQLRQTLRKYLRFFENKERVAKLKALRSDYSSPSRLHLDILTVLSAAEENSLAGIIRSLLRNGLDAEENSVLENIRKFGDETVLWELVHQYIGYTHTEGSSLFPLAAHLLLTALSATMNKEILRGFENYISEPHTSMCYSLIHEWLYSRDDRSLYNLASAVEERLELPHRFDSLEVTDLLSSECFPCINECILKKFLTGISADHVAVDDIFAAVEKRRTLKWYDDFRFYFSGIFAAAQMQQFYYTNHQKFSIAHPAELWKAYCEEFYKMDSYYRAFHTAFGQSLRESSTDLADLYKGAADYVEKLYKNWFLPTLGGQWNRLIAGEMEQSPELAGIPQQSNFYRSHVLPLVSSGTRAYVIISDALRYEIGAELALQLNREMRGKAKLGSFQSIFPSTTKYGMAALLPHRTLTLSEDLRVLCDEMPSDGLSNRKKILQRIGAGNVALTYRSFLSMKKAERREQVSGASVVYIYHNAIDAVGDKASTEEQVFEACENTIKEVKNLVRLIVNDLSGSNILITADHGFIYSYQPLKESDKAEQAWNSESAIEANRRYMITRGESQAEHMLRIPLAHLQSSACGFTPLEYIRIKRPGGGMNYVHGGVSLQESVLPVITYKDIRATSSKFVDVAKAKIQLISQNRKISNSIFFLEFYQTEAVGPKVTPATYELFLRDSLGNIVSDTQKFIADKENLLNTERVTRVRFTLKGMEFQKTETYYLTIVDQETGIIMEPIEFTIDIAFANDFGF